MIRRLQVAAAVMALVLAATGCDGRLPGPHAGGAPSESGGTPAGGSAEPAPSFEGDDWGMSPGHQTAGAAAAVTGGLRPLARYPFDTFVSAGPVR